MKRSTLACVAIICAVAAYYCRTVLWFHAEAKTGLESFDFYAYFYPNILYAGNAIREGSGLLWNPYQSCGEPFFANSLTGVLNPFNLPFVLLHQDAATLTSLTLSFVVAGLGMFALCRELRLGLAASLCGALAFELSASVVHLATWTPVHAWPYVLIPLAVRATERVLRLPSNRTAIMLGLVLSLQLVSGFPQTSFFTYQILLLQFVWGLGSKRSPHPLFSLGALIAALVLPVLLCAVQFLPILELARESIRNGALKGREMGGFIPWDLFRQRAGGGILFPFNILSIVVVAMSSLAFFTHRLRGHAWLFLFIAVVYFLLSLGHRGPLFPYYIDLPLGALFRGPRRFGWIANFAVTMLVALGAQTMLDDRRSRQNPTSILLPFFTMIAASLAFYSVFPNALLKLGGAWGGGLLLAYVLTTASSRARQAVSILLPIAIVVSCITFVPRSFQNLRTGDPYSANAEAFEYIRDRITPQDRVFIAGMHRDYALMAKSASLFRLPTVYDYEQQTSRRYAQYFTYAKVGLPYHIVDNWSHLELGGWKSKDPLGAFKRGLFDLSAVRFLLVDPALDTTIKAYGPDARLMLATDRVHVYENVAAFSRARFVPKIAVMPRLDSLVALASGKVDTRRVAITTTAPRSGFLGRTSGAPNPDDSYVEFLTDDAERIVLSVYSTVPGFLLLADQYYPGWSASVNSDDAEILEANGTFRLVEVPAGMSTVEFVYRPMSLYVGALISLIAWLLVGLAWFRGDRLFRVPEAVR